MAGQFSTDRRRPLAGLQADDGAEVVQTPTGDERPRLGIGAGHDPAGAQTDCIDLDDTRNTNTSIHLFKLQFICFYSFIVSIFFVLIISS